MDDATFQIPNQPNNDDNRGPRPEGADSAADIARSKLNAIYSNQQRPSDATSHQPQSPTQNLPHTSHQQQQPYPPQTVQSQPSTNDNAPQPAPSYHQLKQHSANFENSNPQPQAAPPEPATPTSQQTVERDRPHAQEPTTAPGYNPETRTLQPATTPPQHDYASSGPQRPRSFEPQPYQPRPVATTEAASQAQIIQPTPANDAPVLNPSRLNDNQLHSDYVPTQQYAQEVSLEEQIDGLHHTAPDHQLSIQAQQKVKKSWIPYNLQPLLRTLVLAGVIAIIYNHQFLVGQVQSYINPAQSIVSPTIISPSMGENVSDENKLIIPKINVDIPVVYDVTTFDEPEVQAGLERGVVHYGTTALPGENGNNVIVGHSSNNFWNNGDYKFAFVLLNKLSEGDTFTLHYEGTAYTYEVFRRKVVPPTAVDVIFEDFGEPVVTLITCDPPGTAWNRLVVNARQISPDPDGATTPAQPSGQPDEVINVPGDSSSLLENLFN